MTTRVYFTKIMHGGALAGSECQCSYPTNPGQAHKDVLNFNRIARAGKIKHDVFTMSEYTIKPNSAYLVHGSAS